MTDLVFFKRLSKYIKKTRRSPSKQIY